MAYSITPSLGIDLSYVGPDSDSTTLTPALGTVVKGSDGHNYIFAKASAAIASAAVCILTEPAMTMATGAGKWTAPTVTGGVPSGEYAWFMETAIA